MRRRDHSPEQITRRLQTGDRILNEGAGVEEMARRLKITTSTWHPWKYHYGGMQADDAKRRKELGRDNQRLKKVVADQALNIDMLKGLAEGKF